MTPLEIMVMNPMMVMMVVVIINHDVGIVDATSIGVTNSPYIPVSSTRRSSFPHIANIDAYVAMDHF
jgi:rRNA processing protein Gar1